MVFLNKQNYAWTCLGSQSFSTLFSLVSHILNTRERKKSKLEMSEGGIGWMGQRQGEGVEEEDHEAGCTGIVGRGFDPPSHHGA